MEKPKSITQLTKEQLEDIVIGLLHNDKIKSDHIKDLEQQIQKQQEVIDKGIEYINNHLRQVMN